MSKIAKTAAIFMIGLAFVNPAFADSNDEYYIAPPSEIVDLNLTQPIHELKAELGFYQNKLSKVKEHIEALEIKLKTAYMQDNRKRMILLRNLLVNQYRRIGPIRKQIIEKQNELAALQVKAAVASAFSDPDESRVACQKPKKNDGLLTGVATTFDIDVDTRSDENGPVDQAQISANFTASKGPAYFQYSHIRCYLREVDPFYAEVNSEFQGTVNNRFTVGVSFTPGIGNMVKASSVKYGAGDDTQRHLTTSSANH